MDEADYQLLEEIAVVLQKKRSKNWVDIHNLRVIKYGSTLHIDLHLTLPWFFNLKETQFEMEAISQAIESNTSKGIEVFMHTDPCLPRKSCEICTKEDCQQRKHHFKKKLKWTLENLMEDRHHEYS